MDRDTPCASFHTSLFAIDHLEEIIGFPFLSGSERCLCDSFMFVYDREEHTGEGGGGGGGVDFEIFEIGR
jgi:hypothetical protein